MNVGISLKRQIWNAERFGLTPLKLRARFAPQTESRILCVSIPKAGTHLLERALCLHPALYRPFIRTLTARNIDKYGGERNVLRNLDRGQLLIGHLYYNIEFAEAIRAENIRSLFIIRDPRDISISNVHYVLRTPRHRSHERYARQKNFRDRLIISIQGPSDGSGGLGKRLDRYSGWLRSDALVVRFEDLVGATGGDGQNRRRDELSRIFQFIGVGLSEIQLSRISANLVSDASPTFRKGSVGDWRQHFDPEIKELFKMVANEQLIRYGYENSANW